MRPRPDGVMHALYRGMRQTLPLLLVLGAACSAGDTAPASDAGPGVDAAPLELPAGYTLTPFLSSGPVRSFSAAGDAIEPDTDYVAVIESTGGRMVIELFADRAPITVNSFVWLTLHHYHDGLAFHRVVEDFVAQTGDPKTLEPDSSSWGSGGPGYGFGVEIDPTLSFDAAGIVGMARAAALDSNGSQFFVTVAPATFLDGDYTIFGRLVEGLEVLPLIVRGEPPAAPTRMLRVTIAQRPR
jgi:cyclophilin family peptidyl-prolyl cis-trans isomerase